MSIIKDEKPISDADLMSAMLSNPEMTVQSGTDFEMPAVQAPIAPVVGPDPRTHKAPPDERDLVDDPKVVDTEPLVDAEMEEVYTDPPLNDTPVGNPEVETLRQELAMLRSALQIGGIKPQQSMPTQAQAKSLDPSKYALSQDEIDQVLDDPTIFNKKIMALAQDFGDMLSQTKTQPEAIQSIVEGIVTAQNKVKEFYELNPDLNTPERRYIVQIAMEKRRNQLTSGGQPVEIDALLQATEGDVRRALGLKRAPRVRRETIDPDKPKTKDVAASAAVTSTRAAAKPAGKTPSLPGGNKSGRGKVPEAPTGPKTQQDYMRDLMR